MDCGSGSRAPNGRFTTHMHQVARDAEAAGLQRLAEDVEAEEVSTTPAQAVSKIERRANRFLRRLDSYVREDFVAWLARQYIDPLEEEHLDELLDDWRMTSEYETKKAERIVDERIAYGSNSDEEHCTYDGDGMTREISGVTCDDYQGLDTLEDRLNYGSRAGEWTPSEPAAVYGPVEQLLNVPEASSFCAGCQTFRPGETGLSHVELWTPFGKESRPRRVQDRPCRHCVCNDPEDYW